jgi:SAM-dependent methyltransferase
VANPLITRAVADVLRQRAQVFRGTVVDVGAGYSPYRSIVGGGVERWLRVDADPGVEPDVVGDACHLSLPDGSADLVLCVGALEETEDPALAFREFARIARPGGSVIVLATQNWRELQAHDYFRFTRQGLRLLAERAGLEVVEAAAYGGFFAQFGAKIATLGRESAGRSPLLGTLTGPVWRLVEAGASRLDARFRYDREPLLVFVHARRP